MLIRAVTFIVLNVKINEKENHVFLPTNMHIFEVYMKYEESLINLNNKLCKNDSMYSLVLLSADSLTITLSGYRCYLDGKYIICLSGDDKLSVHSGRFEAKNLSFQPYFYNINLNTKIIDADFYDEMREKYGYPDFRLFRMRDNDYIGIIAISNEEYCIASLYFDQAKRDIDSHIHDAMWSCRTRSDIISILRIAESAFSGKEIGIDNEIIRYIYDNISAEITLDVLCERFNTNRTSLSQLIKQKTGFSPMKFILETRLVNSCQDLLFTRLPINEIANRYGISDANYYIRSFKKRFGKTPLQYRKEGLKARVQDEEIYHRRAEKEINEMTVDEFVDYYNKGLGRAIIKLKQQKDKTPFKQAFWDCISQRNHRVLDIYEKEITDIFDDENFAKNIETYLLNEVSEHFKTKHIPYLIILGKRNELEVIIENYYRTSYAELLEYTKKPWDGEPYPQCANTYMLAAGALGRYIKVGDKRIKEILFDIADLYKYNESPVVPTYQNPLYMIMDGVGKEHFYLILDEAIKENQYVKNFDIRRDIVFTTPDYTEQNSIVTEVEKEFNLADKILSETELNNDLINLWFKFKNNDKESVKRIAKAALEENDVERKAYLLTFFVIYGPNMPPEKFPLDATPLVEWLERENYRISDTPPYSITHSILQLLAYNRQDIARKVGLKMFYDERFAEGEGRYYAMRIRFGANYNPKEDKMDFIALLRSPNENDRNNAIDIFVNNIQLDIDGLPMEMIHHVYANCPLYANRLELCKLLVKKDIMPEDLKEESLYDYCSHIRKLFLQ